MIACVVGNSEVSVDLEEIKEINYDIAERFFTKEEYITPSLYKKTR
ncbi:hypothetical protein LL037_18815 [Clostridium estertheticum]|nr:hypothetical protein [Clostridium estertheticum]MBU3198521.1 hypothetical protein [Clostridium estertheticum]WAG64502.1 hypothetical protein LL037_18815 [Clostridium estertheticum]